jgi:hypothetical protein
MERGPSIFVECARLANYLLHEMSLVHPNPHPTLPSSLDADSVGGGIIGSSWKSLVDPILPPTKSIF